MHLNYFARTSYICRWNVYICFYSSFYHKFLLLYNICKIMLFLTIPNCDGITLQKAEKLGFLMKNENDELKLKDYIKDYILICLTLFRTIINNGESYIFSH